MYICVCVLLVAAADLSHSICQSCTHVHTHCLLWHYEQALRVLLQNVELKLKEINNSSHYFAVREAESRERWMDEEREKSHQHSSSSESELCNSADEA